LADLRRQPSAKALGYFQRNSPHPLLITPAFARVKTFLLQP